MPNAAIELHDSIVTAIRLGSDVVIDLDAYVHVSEGIPGVDAGTGWSQRAQMTVRDGVIRQTFEGETLCIYSGFVRVDLSRLDNMVPREIDTIGTVEIHFVGAEGELIVSGAGLRVEAVGDPVYVERFPFDV